MSTEFQPVKLPYPSNPVVKQALKLPIPLYRMGLGFLVGRLFMVLTTTGRKSRLPRRTAIEFHAHKGRKYVFSAFGEKADWYKNIQADPRVTIQTASGTEPMIARRITDDGKLAEAFELVASNPTMRRWIQVIGFQLTLADFLAKKDSLYLVTFDPTNEPTPPPLEADLRWVWLVVVGLGILVHRMRGRKRGIGRE
jgi:deazaflavin-dependent oxidoreductase (nitroreductase family)